MRTRLLPLTLVGWLIAGVAHGQTSGSDSTTADTAARKPAMNMDAIYNRPFLSLGKLPASIGGYLETKYQRINTDGISEGHLFQFQRMTLFVSASIYRRIKFLSEIEFEEGGKEINIEFAAADIEFDPLLNLRIGMIMNPIGAFNQNHDGPKWEFSDRPVSATQMLPATWSNVGAGLYGKRYLSKWVAAYEAYLTNGFDERIIDNSTGRTFLAATKQNPERFTESNSGLPLATVKGAVRNYKWGEVGLSWMGGVYNRFQDGGVQIAPKRRVDAFAVDFNSTLPGLGTYIVGEYAWVRVDVPQGLDPFYASRQQGGFVDIVQPVYRGNVLRFRQSELRVSARLERVDFNVGQFAETGQLRGDDYWAITGGVSWRPVGQTVLRVNYRIQEQHDLFARQPSRSSGVQIGFATYF